MGLEETNRVRALAYALHHGIHGHKVKGNRMTYYENYPDTKQTVKVTIRLDTFKKETQILTKWREEGNLNIRERSHDERICN